MTLVPLTGTGCRDDPAGPPATFPPPTEGDIPPMCPSACAALAKPAAFPEKSRYWGNETRARRSLPARALGWPLHSQSGAGRMENCCLRCRLLYRQCWGMCLGLAIGVVLVVLATALSSSREPPGGSEGLEELGTAQKALQVKVAALWQALAATDRSLAEVLAVTNRSLAQALDVTNRSLAETRGQWESCRNELVGAGEMGEDGPLLGPPHPIPGTGVRGLLCAAPSPGRGKRAGA